MLQDLQSGSPTPLAAALLRLLIARAFGESTGAAPLLPSPPARPQSARHLAYAYLEGCTSPSKKMLKPPAAELRTALCRLLVLYSSDLLSPPAQSAAVDRRVLHCTLF